MPDFIKNSPATAHVCPGEEPTPPMAPMSKRMSATTRYGQGILRWQRCSIPSIHLVILQGAFPPVYCSSRDSTLQAVKECGRICFATGHACKPSMWQLEVSQPPAFLTQEQVGVQAQATGRVPLGKLALWKRVFGGTDAQMWRSPFSPPRAQPQAKPGPHCHLTPLWMPRISDDIDHVYRPRRPLY